MKSDFLNLKNEYEQINKNDQINHTILKDNYDNLCMKYFSNKYNTLKAQKLANDSSFLARESEDIYVNWLNKEWYV